MALATDPTVELANQLVAMLWGAKLAQRQDSVTAQGESVVAVLEVLGLDQWAPPGRDPLQFAASSELPMPVELFGRFRKVRPSKALFANIADGLGCYDFSDHIDRLWV